MTLLCAAKLQIRQSEWRMTFAATTFAATTFAATTRFYRLTARSWVAYLRFRACRFRWTAQMAERGAKQSFKALQVAFAGGTPVWRHFLQGFLRPSPIIAEIDQRGTDDGLELRAPGHRESLRLRRLPGRKLIPPCHNNATALFPPPPRSALMTHRR